MHHIILNSDKIVPLQKYIDNTNSDINVGLRSITYNVGWYNINHEYVRWTVGGKSVEFVIQPGLYGFDELKSILIHTGVRFDCNISNGIVVMSVPPNYNVQLSNGLKTMLGFNNQKYSSGTHIATKPIDFAPLRIIYVHLNQLNTENNFYNGSPSDVIAIIPVEDKPFGHIVNVRYENPEFKRLADGTISELEIRFTDQNNNVINNHDQPISVVLEFI